MFENKILGTSLLVQWLRLCASKAGGQGTIPGRGTGSCMPQLGAFTPRLRHGADKYTNKIKTIFYFSAWIL